MSSQLKLKDLVQDNIEKGDTSGEEIHKAIAAVPLEVLEKIESPESAPKSTLKIHEETKMRTDGQTLRGNEMVIPHAGLESVKEWAKATFTRERISEVAIYASALTAVGVVLFSLHRAMENYVILGF